MACIYLNKKDYKKSFDFFKKSADLGDADALYNCAALLRDELASPLLKNEGEDDSLVLSYLLRAAEKNHTLAMIHLAMFHLSEADQNKGAAFEELKSFYFWLEKAHSLGDLNAKVLLEETRKQITTIYEEKNKEAEVSPQFSTCLENIEKHDPEFSKEIKINLGNIEENQKPTHIEPPHVEQTEESVSSDEETKDVPLEIKEQPEDVILELEEAKVYFPNKKKKANPTWVKKKLNKAQELFEQEQREQPTSSEEKLSKNSIKIIQRLSNTPTSITINDLHRLFSDPYFKANGRQVLMKNTAFGYVITGMNYKKLNFQSAEIGKKVSTAGKPRKQGKSYKRMDQNFLQNVEGTSTHRKHGQSYKGMDRNFLEEVEKILKIFEIDIKSDIFSN